MTKSRRVMAVIVAALLIVAMILPGLVVKAEAAEGEKNWRNWLCDHEADD